MWSNENRARYDRGKMRYPSDVTDEEWALVASCPSAGPSNAPSPGSAAAAGWPRIGNASIARRSPSSASPPSHNLPGQTLTKRTVDVTEKRGVRYCIWDSALPGFGLRVETSGTKTFIV